MDRFNYDFFHFFSLVPVLLPILRSNSDPERTLKLLTDELRSGLSKMNCLQLTEKYYELIGNADEARTAKDAHLKYKYYIQLRQLDPSIKDDFQITFPELFTSLNQKMFDIQLLERMSRDFEWNYQKVLVTQVNCIRSFVVGVIKHFKSHETFNKLIFM